MQASRWAKQAGSATTSAKTFADAASHKPPVVAEAPAPPVVQVQDTATFQDGVQDEPSMDEFAQTRPPDDLFDDDFIPMEEPVVESEPQAPVAPRAEVPPAGRGGRGSRRGGTGNAAPSASKNNASRKEQQAQATSETVAQDGDEAAKAATVTASSNAPQDAPQAPAKMREKAVQGDRSGTGGVKKAKLTEEELTARLEAMKIKSSQLEAAHARSAADLANFEAREAHAAQRRKEDRQNRQQMMGEREKNRQRKLQALGGREWDAEKKEEDFAPDTRGARRGAHGGIGGSRYAVEARDAEETEGQRSYGGARGRGRGRGGRGRGKDGREGPSGRNDPSQAPPNALDFPELPAAARQEESGNNAPAVLDFPIKGASEKKLGSSMVPSQAEHIKSWADQVEGATTP